MLTSSQIQQLKLANSPQTQNSQPMTPEEAKASFNPAPKLSSYDIAMGKGDNTNYIGDAIKSGVNQVKEGYNQAKTAANPYELLSGGAKMAAGAIGTAMAPIAPIVAPLGKVTEAIGNKVSDIPTVQKFATSKAGENTIKAVNDVNNVNTIVGGVAGAMDVAPKIADVASKLPEKVSGAVDAVKNTTSQALDATKGMAGNIKEIIKPSLTPEEATGQIIQSETKDIPVAKKTFQELTDTNNIKTQKDLSKAIDTQIIKPGLKAVDAEFAKDASKHQIDWFTETTGKGKSAIKTNYVQQGIEQLKTYFDKTNNAEGLSKIIKLENKAKTSGLSFKEVNDLARLHGKELNGFNANGELASGLTKQAAENTRIGLKNTARNGLPTAEAQALDKKVSDAIQTKDMIDNQVEKVNTQTQKNPKVGALPKKFGKIVKTVGHPVDTLSRMTGVTGSGVSYNPSEIEAMISNNLKTIRGK